MIVRRYPETTIWKGGYTGGLITTASPGDVVASSTASTEFITSPARRTWAGTSSCQSQRAAAMAANASA